MYNPYGPYRARKLQYYHEVDVDGEDGRAEHDVEYEYNRRRQLPRPSGSYRRAVEPLSRTEQAKLDLINRNRGVLLQTGRTIERNLSRLERSIDPFATASYFERYLPTQAQLDEERIRKRLQALDQSGDGYDWEGRYIGIGQSRAKAAALADEQEEKGRRAEEAAAAAAVAAAAAQSEKEQKARSSSKVPPPVLEFIKSQIMTDEELAPLFAASRRELTKVLCIMYQYGEVAFSSGKVPVPNDACKEFLKKAKERRETSNQWNQFMLPRMPIPSLEKTFERMLRAVAPLVSPAELEKTKALAEAFCAGVGKRAQAALEAMNAREIPMEESFVTSFWLDHYLRDRRSLMWNNTAGIANNSLWVPLKPGAKAVTGQMSRAAHAIFGTVKFVSWLFLSFSFFLFLSLSFSFFLFFSFFLSLSFFLFLSFSPPPPLEMYPQRFHSQAHKLWANKLKPTKFRDNFLDGSQFKRMFCTTRIPRKGCDELYTAPDPSSVRHIIVLRKNCVFKLPVKDREGRLVSFGLVLGRAKR